jgi:poly-gamma-glutamate capsule biosynthesis protein CapA/YwtB (metallophosphatase superfamily)
MRYDIYMNKVLLMFIGILAVGHVYVVTAPAVVISVTGPMVPRTEDVAAQSTARIFFVGDLLYDRSIRAAADRDGDDFIFSCLANEFARYDLVIANLENPITDNPSVSVGTLPPNPNNYRFTAPLRTADVLAQHNIRAVSIGNNHVYDQGTAGIGQTRATLLSSHILAVGDPTDEHNTSARFTVNNIPITLVAYNEFFPSREWTLPAIASSTTKTSIVFAHWGDEYATTSAPRQQTRARQFIDAGADLVIGSHPHVVQEYTTYKDAPIYYSLGNFMFDNYDNYDVTHGLGLEVVITQEGIQQVIEHPLVLNRDRRTCYAGD